MYNKYKVIDKKIECICKNDYRYFLHMKNVQGIAKGYKIVKGFSTYIICITVFVYDKKPLCKLSLNDRIPKFYKGFRTDVVESGFFESQSLRDKIRPAIGGYSIGIVQCPDAGSLGCLVTASQKNYILSTNHVMAFYNTAPLGSIVMQPAIVDGGKANQDVIAKLSAFIPLKFKTSLDEPENYVDCAIAEVTDKSLVSKEIALIGKLQGISLPKEKQKVKKAGRTTGLTTGEVKHNNATINFNYTLAGKTVLLKNQIITTSMSQGGDSGSLLLDSNNNVVGLVIGGGSYGTVVNPIIEVLNRLNVSLVIH